MSATALSLALIPLLAATATLEDPIQPSEWLVLDGVDERGRRPFREDAVFATHLLRAEAAPQSGQVLRGSEREAAWTAVSTEGRVALRGRGAYAYAALEREQAGLFLAELRGAATLIVNGESVAGDVYRYGFEGYPIALRAGRNDLYVTGARGGFDLKLVPAAEGLQIGARDRIVPDLVRGERQVGPIGLLLRNVSHEAFRWPRFELEGPDYLRLVPQLLPVGPDRLPALGLGRVSLVLENLGIPEGVSSVPIVLREVQSGAEAALELAVRAPGERQRRTYRSEVDGSVQEFVVNPPQGSTDQPMRLAISLHGAGVGAWGQAASYGPKPDFWVVAPTNRRKFGFDWQDWGRRDAYDVLDEALRLSGVHASRVYVTGHSMGGHGTWHLAANDPDRFAACGPSAGWATFDTYGGRPEGSRQELWHRADAASLTFEVVDNLKQVAPFVIHGTADRNVPPSQALSMLEALAKAGATVEVHLEGGAGHWWGGRCVDWPPLFDHFRSHELDLDPDRLEFVTVDPAVDAKHHWLRIERPARYGASSRVSAERKEGAISITTENVGLLRLANGAQELTIDGQSVGAVRRRGYVALGEDGWATHEPVAGEKSPEHSGPFKRAFDHNFLLVVGTQGDGERDAVLLGRARHDAGVWTYRAGGNAPIVTDVEYLAATQEDPGDPNAGPNSAVKGLWPTGRNVILYGNRDDNAAFGFLVAEDGAFDVRDGQLRVGETVLHGDHAGVFFHPSRGQHPYLGTIGLHVGVFASTSTAAARLGDTFATFISGAGFPDYAVVSADVLSEGDDAVVLAGWWDAHWRVQQDD